MIFEQLRADGCLSYVIGCDETRVGMIVDPHLDLTDRYLAMVAEKGLRIRYIAETHTHADHFTSAHELARKLEARTVMHHRAVAPHVDIRIDDGEQLLVGGLKVRALYTPGHTADSCSLLVGDKVLTGDTLLIGGTGRTDLPSGDPDALFDSIFTKLLRLDDSIEVYPAHDYKGRTHSTIGKERLENPRLQKKTREEFVALMRGLDLAMPRHLTEALRTNRTGGKTVKQLIQEAAAMIPFMPLDEVRSRITTNPRDLVILDVREKDAYEAAHIPGARHVPRGQLEILIDSVLPDPTVKILAYCQLGKVSTLAAATLKMMGFTHVIALDGGFEAWKQAGYPTESGYTENRTQ